MNFWSILKELEDLIPRRQTFGELEGPADTLKLPIYKMVHSHRNHWLTRITDFKINELTTKLNHMNTIRNTQKLRTRVFKKRKRSRTVLKHYIQDSISIRKQLIGTQV